MIIPDRYRVQHNFFRGPESRRFLVYVNDYGSHIWVLPLEDNELKLDRGRFERFVPTQQEWKIDVDTDEIGDHAYPVASLLEWVVENTSGRWSLIPHFGSSRWSNHLSATFSFADHRDAIAFKLRWN